MGNRWIVTQHKYHQHKKLKDAEKERDRLAAKCPKQTFHIHRIKLSLEPSKAPSVIKGLVKALEAYLDAQNAAQIRHAQQMAFKALEVARGGEFSSNAKTALSAVAAMDTKGKA